MFQLTSWSLARWVRARAALVLLSCGLGAALLLARAQEGDSWDDLLAQHGVTGLQEVQWLHPPSEGEWAGAVVAAVPPPIHGEPARGRDLLFFEGMVDGSEKPFRVRNVGNLHQTPHADDVLLDFAPTGDGWVALTGSRVDGAFLSVSLLSLRGDPLVKYDDQGQKRSAGDRFKLSLVRWQEEGRPEGVGKRVFVLEKPHKELSARWDHGKVVFRAQSDEGKLLWTSVDLQSGEREEGTLGGVSMEEQSRAVTAESWTQFAVNRARRVPWIGPHKIALLEKYVFDRVDEARQAWYGAVGVDREALAQEMIPEAPPAPEVQPARVLPKGERPIVLSSERVVWPPPALDPPAREWSSGALPGEGQWTPWVPEWDKGRAVDGQWPVVRAAVRVNKHKEYEHISLIAMDMRRFDLHLLGGTVSPKSTTGLKGTGLIPRDPEVFKRLVLAFNGGFKTSHGAFGMMLDRKVFVPPKPATATLGFWDDGSIRMGSWPGKAPTGHYRTEHQWQIEVARADKVAPIPKDVVSMRQNLFPLVAEGEVNPSGARRWGGAVGHLSHTSTPRSALCMRGDHTLIYVWGHRCSASDLGRAMLLASCEYGMHMDMNPYHTGMAMYHVPLEGDAFPESDKKTGFVGARMEMASPKMSFDQFRYLRKDVKDFFYLTRRAFLPDRLGASRGVAWQTRGLPVARGGVEPLMVSSEPSPGVFALGWSSEGVLPRPGRSHEGEPERGAEGEVIVQFSLEQEGGEAPPVEALFLGAGALLVEEGGESRNEAWKSAERPVLLAKNADGDSVLLSCDACDGRDLVAVLELMGAREKVWFLGTGALRVESFEEEGGWRQVFVSSAVPYPQTVRGRLLPEALRPRTGVSRFEASEVVPPGARSSK